MVLLDGKRKAGRPKLRWVDGVQANLKVTGIKGRASKAKTDQNGWKPLERLRSNC